MRIAKVTSRLSDGGTRNGGPLTSFLAALPQNWFIICSLSGRRAGFAETICTGAARHRYSRILTGTFIFADIN